MTVPSPVLRPREGITAVGLDGEVVLYDAGGRRLHHLNATAALFWQQCDGTRSVADIVAAVVDADSGADQATVQADFDALVADLTRAGLLEAVA